MIQEIARILVQPGHEEAFEQGVAQARPLFLRARGCHGVALYRGIEKPLAYTLVVQWETVEDHTVHFRESADFQAWRELVGPHFASPPAVHHVQQVI